MRNKIYAWLIGTGILLMAIHNRLLTGTDAAGVTWFFLPTIGVYVAMLGTFACLLENHKKITFGSKFVYIPLAVIAVSIVASDVYQFAIGSKTIMQAYYTLLFGVFLFGLYLVARILKEELFKPFMFAVIIVAISAIPYALILSRKTGGLASPTNYDMGAGLLIMGTLVSGLKRRWWLATIAILGLMFMGAEEGYFALLVLGITVLIRKDFSRKLLAPAGIAVVGVFALAITGQAGTMVNPSIEKLSLAKSAMFNDTVYAYGETIEYRGNEYRELLVLTNDDAWNIATGDRIGGYWRLSPIEPLGHGYNIDKFYDGIPHNMVLIIIEQVGIAAALAWLFVIFYCLIKTKWKYAFIGVLALSVFDHYLWTQVAPWTWAIIGVATASEIKRDLIFKEA